MRAGVKQEKYKHGRYPDVKIHIRYDEIKSAADYDFGQLPRYFFR